jgi:hypothetical protein
VAVSEEGGSSCHGDGAWRVELIGHASLRIRHAEGALLTDPWFIDPIACNTGFHFPPLVHDPVPLAAEASALYISHIHPDHFHPPTLARFPKGVPVYIGEHPDKGFRDAVAGLGFKVVEVPFQTPTPVAGTALTITILESGYAENDAFDSAMLLSAPGFTVFNNNDCFLADDKYRWVRDNFVIDYAFLGYSPASFYPVCFEMEEAERQRLLAEVKEHKYTEFVHAATLLRPRIAVPFAMGMRFLHPAMLSKNAMFNSAAEAVRRLDTIGVRGEAMGPGDRICSDDSVARRRGVPSAAEEEQAIAELSGEKAAWIESLWRTEPPPRPDILEQLRDHVLARWRRCREALPDLKNTVIAFRVEGAEPRECHFDFSRADADVFGYGMPSRYDMRYTYPGSLLQQVLDGRIDWDELHYSCRVSIQQVRYARDYYTMLRSGLGARR